EFVFDYIDTTDEKPYLPIFISEAVSEYYYKRFPKMEKEIIKATKVSGIENQTVSQFMGDMYQNVNIYNNYINIFGKSFVSPISDFGFFSYRYYLTDSGFVDNNWCYKIKFVPKRKHELTFDGEMWINDTTYAVKKITATINEEANINFIKRFDVEQTYRQVQPEVWMLVQDKAVADFNLADKQVGFYGRKNTYYRKFVINQPLPDEFYLSGLDIELEKDASEKPEDFWDTVRAEQLSEKEAQIYHMVDSIKNVPVFRSYVDIIQLIVTGYHVWGNVELGPYFTTYSFNQVEGSRFRIGGRTSNQFSKRLMIEAYLAYGLRDKRFKYGAWFDYYLTKLPRQHFGLSYKNDVEQLGQSQNAWRQDNILASVFRRNPFNKINGYEEYSGFFEREWFFGFSNKISLSHRRIWPLGVLDFEKNTESGTIPVNNITTAEIGIYTRFAYKEKYVSGEFERISLGTKWPILQAQYFYGLKNFFGSQYEYHKIIVNIQDKMKLNPFGEMEYAVEAGKLFGTLPYPLLFLHNGNETYFYDFSAFNLMNYYEFASDQYVSLAATHHFNGLFFNKIPLINKLKWREVISGKAVYGTLSDKHKQEMIYPQNFQGLYKGPYIEGGVGIENIFKLFRVDALWRFTYLDHPNIVPWGIRTTFQFMF
ncbi:MAG: carboxypeptidase-like regulatory domain-containing protein, partial [Bacteroidetes bacterium]